MNNLTRNQHYIPQVYLRGFSPDYLGENRERTDEAKFRIYAYNLNKEEKVNNPIPIKSICLKKDLYEINDSNENIVSANFLEKWLGVIESKFSYYRK